MKKFYFIVNPISGHANNVKYAEDIIKLLHKKADVETHMHVLQARGEAEPYAAKLADEIKDDGIIVSVGGDGTFNEIASSLVGKSTPIAIIPRGSGNGLARMLRVPTQKMLQAEYLLKGHTIKIDNGNFGDRKYFCTAGFGFEACIAFLFDKTGNKKRGRQQYVHHIIKEIFNYKPVEAELEIDGKREKGKYFLKFFNTSLLFLFIVSAQSYYVSWLSILYFCNCPFLPWFMFSIPEPMLIAESIKLILQPFKNFFNRKLWNLSNRKLFWSSILPCIRLSGLGMNTVSNKLLSFCQYLNTVLFSILVNP